MWSILRARGVELLLLLLLTGIHAGYLSFPPEDPDVGGITYNAMLINRGLVPYRDSFEQKLPGAWFFVACWTRVLGESTLALNTAGALWSLAHLVILMWGVRRLWGSTPSRWAGAAFVLASTAPVVSGRCPNYELWMTMPITGAVMLVMTAGNGSVLRILAAGFLAATGVLVKQQAAFSCLPLLAWAVGTMRQDVGRGMKAFVWLAIGGIAAAVPVVGYFVAQGELATFFGMIDPRGAVVYASGGGSSAALVWRIARQETMRVVHEMPLLYFAGTTILATMTWSWIRSASTRGMGLISLWIVGAALGVAAGMRFYTHYYIQLIPPLSIAVGWVVDRMQPSLRGSSREAAAAFLLAAALGWSSTGRVVHDARMAWWQVKFAVQGRVMPAIAPMRLAAEINRHLAPGERILVWGHAEDMYFLARRLAPTRYYKYYAFLTPPPITWWPPSLNPRAVEHSARFLNEITLQPPRAVVVSSLVGSAPTTIFPEFEAFLTTRFRHHASFDGLDLWLPLPMPETGVSDRPLP